MLCQMLAAVSIAFLSQSALKSWGPAQLTKAAVAWVKAAEAEGLGLTGE